jgi:transcriptional regulator with XRE-family HTH domain
MLECHYSGQAFSFAKFYTRPMGLRIKELRDGLGMTQEELASKAKMSRSQLAMIERETRPANTLRLNAIAAALGVPPEDLFESDGADRELARIVKRLSDEDRATLVRLAEALAAKTDPA